MSKVASDVLNEQLKLSRLTLPPRFVEIPKPEEEDFAGSGRTTSTCLEYDDSYLGSFFQEKNAHYLKKIGIALLVIMVIMVIVFSIFGETLGTYNYIALALVPLTISMPFFWSSWLANKCLHLRDYDAQQQINRKMQNADILRIEAQNEANHNSVYRAQQKYTKERSNLKQQGEALIKSKLQGQPNLQETLHAYRKAFDEQFPPIHNSVLLPEKYGYQRQLFGSPNRHRFT